MAAERAEALGSLPLAAEAATPLAQIRTGYGESESWTPLTAREYEAATLIAGGNTDLEVAAELGIAPKPASAHVEHILAKLGVTRRAEVAAWFATRSRR